MSVKRMSRAVGGTEAAVEAISFEPRFVFDCSDWIIDLFTPTSREVTLPPEYLPPRDLLIAWVRRLKDHLPQLETFKLVIVFSTFGTDAVDLPPDTQMLEFEYNATHADMDSQQRSTFSRSWMQIVLKTRGTPTFSDILCIRVRSLHVTTGCSRRRSNRAVEWA